MAEEVEEEGKVELRQARYWRRTGCWRQRHCFRLPDRKGRQDWRRGRLGRRTGRSYRGRRSHPRDANADACASANACARASIAKVKREGVGVTLNDQ